VPKLELLFKRSVAKDLRPLGKKDRERIFAALRRLSENPFQGDVEKLAVAGCFRLRVGRYRVLFQIDQSRGELVVFKVAHRSTAYKGL